MRNLDAALSATQLGTQETEDAGRIRELVAQQKQRSEINDRGGAAETESALRQVAAALDPLVAGLHKSLPSAAATTPVPTSPPAADPAQTRAAAALLTKLLADFDPGAVEFIGANQAALRPLLPGDAWRQLEELLHGCAFAEEQAQLLEATRYAEISSLKMGGSPRARLQSFSGSSGASRRTTMNQD
jgi:hypothetical protein